MNEDFVQNIISSINQITQDACTVLFQGKSFDNGYFFVLGSVVKFTEII